MKIYEFEFYCLLLAIKHHVLIASPYPIHFQEKETDTPNDELQSQQQKCS